LQRTRVELLADTAIELLAESGMRSLTHRAVDARAGVPVGSTSAYFRTREALIEGVVRRLAELDHRDFGLAERADRTSLLAPDGPPFTAADLDEMAAISAALVDRWLTTDRHRTLARYHCVLEATHRPQLRTILGHGGPIRALAHALLARAGAPSPQRRGDYYVAFIDGLLFDRLVGAGGLSAPAPGTAASRDDLRQAVRAALHGLVTAQG
jgi:AcrR family transcriptional regulator